MVQENALWPGWETVKLLGRGSFGAVYEIRRDLFGTTEAGAVKVISIPQNDSEIDDLRADGYDQESIENTYSQHMRSIVGEYAVMCKLNACPNIVDCKDVRYEQHPDGIGWDIFIKMELLTPLVKAFPGQISEQLVLKAGKDLCHALILCKQHNVLHRDIKPQNIFVSNAGDFKLGDFGIAKTVERTMGGTKIGTYKYMAPEVYNSQPYGSAADIYSLGLVLYWMLNDHRLPFLPMPPAMPTFSQEEDAKQRRFRGEPIPAPKNGSEALKAIVLKACAFNPSDRFHSAAEMLQALEQAERAPAPAPAAPVQTEAPSYAPQEATVRARPVPQVKPQPEPAPEPQQALPSPKTRSERFPVITTLLGIAFILLATIIHSLPLWGLGIVILFLGFLPRKTTWTDIVAVSAGQNYTVGLKKNGTVVAVGSNDDGQCNVRGWTDIVAISAGNDHTVGLKKNNTVVAVGWNDDGQCNVSG